MIEENKGVKEADRQSDERTSTVKVLSHVDWTGLD